jgi:hypothetical protein
MANKYFFILIFIGINCFFTFCKTSPPSNVKIIEEKDPVVKTIEEKDSMRLVPHDTTSKPLHKK